MKVSIGSKIVQGPWGGGNLFAINLSASSFTCDLILAANALPSIFVAI